MVKRFKKFDPQLVVVEQLDGSAIALTNEAKLSLYKKSQKSGIPTNILETVYYRGYNIWNESFGQTPEQFAFDRVNSFIAGGFAADLDDDLITEDGKGYKNPTGGLTQKGRDHYNRTTGSHLKAPVTTPPSKLKAGSKSANRRKSFCARMGGVEGPMRKPNGEPTRKALALRKWNCEETQIDEKRGLWDNIHAKRERIKHGSGEHMRKPGSKGAPTAADLKNSQNEEYTGSDPKSSDKNNPLSRMDGTRSAAQVYAGDTPNQKLPPKRKILGIIKKTVKEEVKLDKDKLSHFKLRLNAKKAETEIDMAEKGEPHPATEIPADFLNRKNHAQKYTPDGVEKTVKHGDGFGSVQQHLRGTLSQQVHSNQGGKFNIKKEETEINTPINEISTPLGTTGKRVSTHMKTGPVRNAAGKIVTTNVYKSGSSRGGGGSGSAGGSGGGGGSSGDA